MEREIIIILSFILLLIALLFMGVSQVKLDYQKCVEKIGLEACKEIYK